MMFYAQELFMGKTKDFIRLWFLQDNNSCSGELQRKAGVTLTFNSLMCERQNVHCQNDAFKRHEPVCFVFYGSTDEPTSQSNVISSVLTKSTQGLKKSRDTISFLISSVNSVFFFPKDSMN